jgi:peptide-methionine (S)-S-oxide reductase
MEPPFDELDGVISTISGYSGGHTQDPNYQQISSGTTGHTEVVQITYDPDKISFRELLEVYWVNIDPTTPDRQFCDQGSQYRSALFYHDEEQKQLIEQSKQTLDKTKPFKQPIVTEIIPFERFYAAEDYHQDYYRKNPIRYKYYRYACGRDKRLQTLWGKTKT